MCRAEAVLGFFVRAPRPGSVKTRLGLPEAEAAVLYRAFVQDMAGRLLGLEGVRLVAAVTPPGALAEVRALLPARFELAAQAEGSLGRRMAAFCEWALGRGAAGVAIVGSDLPTLPLAYIERGLAALVEHPVVLGPATDGGYYFIGLGEPRAGLFEGIAWGTNRVLTQTLERAPEGTLLLPPWHDIDTPADLECLAAELAALPEPVRPPRTLRCLRGLGLLPLQPAKARGKA